ncbi:MAG: fibronectin type III-like domain-contianing protein, partial [Halodesulfurarchaeum sp.]
WRAFEANRVERYDDLSIDVGSIGPMGTLTASVTVTNTGDVAGHEVVQLYASAENPTLVRPVQELLGFERLSLEPGESKRVTFDVDATQLAYHDLNMNLAVEAGPYELRVGRSASDVVSTAAFEVTDTKTVPTAGRTYFADTDVEPVR